MLLKITASLSLLFSCASGSEPLALTTGEQASTEQLIKLLLAQDLGTRKFPFPDVIKAATGKKLLPLQAQDPTQKIILAAIHHAAQETLEELNQANSPVRKLRRINEASRFFENLILNKINQIQDLECTIPENTKGHQQRSGYPDMLITHTASDGTKTRAYLDPKLFEGKSRASSLRTFYYEPRTHTNKVQYDALHLLLGIGHDGNQGAWQFTHWEVCDLAHFRVRLKAEFQASNRDIYRKPLIIPVK